MARNTKERGQETRTGVKAKESAYQQETTVTPEEGESRIERHVRRLRQLGIKVDRGSIKPQERSGI